MKKSILKKECRKILILTLSNLGDVIITLPVFTSFRKRYPYADIDCLVGNRVYPFLKDNALLRRVIPYDKESSLGEKMGLLKRLRAERYDFVLDFRNSLIPYLIGRPSRSLWLNAMVKKIPSRYQRIERLIELLGLPEPDPNELHLYSSLDCERLIRSLRSKGVYSLQNLLVIAPGARWELKQWPAEHFAKLITLLTEAWDLVPVLVGDAADRETCERVETMTDSAECINLCGKNPVGQFTFLVERARLVISNDSAAMHLANYYRRPVIGIFGPTDPEKYGYTSERSRIARPEKSWEDIQSLSDESKRKELAAIRPEYVFSLARELLSGER